MKYPSFLKDNDLIGITAPSAGVGSKIDDFEKSIENIKSHNFNVIETKSVRNDSEVSTTAAERIKELNELLENDDVKLIISAAGGDFLYEIMPYIDYNLIKNNPKWIMGASDPTNLLYTITTNLDIATLYGHNAGSIDSKDLDKSQEVALSYLKGDILEQESYSKYESNRDNRINNNYALDKKVKWELLNDEFDITGRLIGGCIDCLRYLPGTKYDKTKEFIEKYKKDGIIWYFDIFSMTTEDFYLTLLQLKDSGWFNYVKGVIVGRVIFPNSYTSMTYQDALKTVFGNIPLVFNADIGHVPPKMTLINGCVANIKASNYKGIIKQYLK